MRLVKYKGRKGFWMAMGSVRLPEIRWRLRGNTFYMEEVTPLKMYDRYGNETKEPDKEFIVVEGNSKDL